MSTIEQIKSELYSLDIEILIELVYNVSDIDISSDLNDLLYNEEPCEIARMMEYGDCSVKDDYFIIDAYGNLKSFTKKELKDDILNCCDTAIAEYLINNPDQLRDYLDI